MTLPAGDLPEGPAVAILAWAAGDQERLEIAHSVEMKTADPREDVVDALERELFGRGFWGGAA